MFKTWQQMAIWTLFAGVVCAATADDGAEIRGKIVQAANPDFKLDLAEIPLVLRQVVQIPDPPFPENWQNMSVDQRQKWYDRFEASAAGKQYIAENEKKLAAAALFEIEIENDGSFVVYDVPVGNYGLRGRVDKKIGGVDHAFEVFGQVSVVREVDELLLQPLMVLVTPLLKKDDRAPDFRISQASGEGEWKLGDFSGQFLLIQFWSPEYSPPSIETQQMIQKTFLSLRQQHKLNLLSICLDSDRAAASRFIEQGEFKGEHALTGGWQHRVLESYGVRRIPAFWLIDPEGRIRMTSSEIRQAIADQEVVLADRMAKRMTGQDEPTLATRPDRSGVDQ